MITRVAIKVDDRVFVGEKEKRHDSVIHEIFDVLGKKAARRGVQGFIDDKGSFLDRHDSAKHAFKCGQLLFDKTCPDIILSEDLW